MILIQTNAGTIAKEFGLTVRQLNKVGSEIVNKITIANCRALKIEANRIKFEGGLSRSIYFQIYPSGKRGEVKLLGDVEVQALALEYGPQAIGINPSTGYKYTLGHGNSKLDRWMESRHPNRKSINIGKEPKTKFGKPSHQFITNARRGMQQREERIVRDELNKLKLGGK